jgi:hypothetical protein
MPKVLWGAEGLVCVWLELPVVVVIIGKRAWHTVALHDLQELDDDLGGVVERGVILKSLRRNEVSASEDERAPMLAFRGSMSVESALLDGGKRVLPAQLPMRKRVSRVG